MTFAKNPLKFIKRGKNEKTKHNKKKNVQIDENINDI